MKDHSAGKIVISFAPDPNDVFLKALLIYLCVVLGDQVDIHFSIPTRKISPLFLILSKSRKSTRFALNFTLSEVSAFYAPGAWTFHPYY